MKGSLSDPVFLCVEQKRIAKPLFTNVNYESFFFFALE